MMQKSPSSKPQKRSTFQIITGSLGAVFAAYCTFAVFVDSTEKNHKAIQYLAPNLLSKNTHNVTLIIPSSIINPIVTVDGVRANITQSTSNFIVIEITESKEQRKFEILGSGCITNQTILTDRTKVILDC